MGSQLGRHALRIAIKDEETNKRMLKIISGALGFPKENFGDSTTIPTLASVAR
jgi:hypothetical protein